MVVQQHILNWLYSVLTSEYHDVNRTYDDVAQALSQYPSLSPRTDVHTSDNGTSALLLHLSGTIPVAFRGTTYRFPISVWVPHAYPRQAPMVYVTPTETMMVRPGQHVDPQGQVYHPYLVGWAEFWDKSSILDFLAVLRDVFAKEPPVISRQPASRTVSGPPPQLANNSGRPPIPPLPPELSNRPPSLVQSPGAASDAGRPPPPPPKGNEQLPPRPPPPPGAGQESGRYGSVTQPVQHPRYRSAPPLPPQTQGGPRQGPPAPVASPPYQQPPHPQPPYQRPPGPVSQQPYPDPDQYRMSQMPLPPAASQNHSLQQPQWQQQFAQPRQYPPHQDPPPFQPHPQPTPKAPPPPDIMDEPLTLSVPSPSQSSLPAPPIPPNPEKDTLLRQLASTLYAARLRSRAQNDASLAGLAAQRAAMLAALGTMQAELSGLSQLSALLGSNTSALHDALRRADAILEGGNGNGGDISSSQAQSAGRPPPPGIDELLVAPTVVAVQLYDLVAEERALADAIFVLGRAVERGRVSPQVFARTTRGLARDWYLKKALVRKIGKGMGLAA